MGPSIFKSSQTPSLNYSQHTNHANAMDATPKSMQYHNNIYSKSDSFMPEIDSFCPEFSPLSPTKSPYLNGTSNYSTERILHFAPVNTQKNMDWNVNTNTSQSDKMSENEEEDDDDDDDLCSITVNKRVKGQHNNNNNNNHNVLLQNGGKMSLD